MHKANGSPIAKEGLGRIGALFDVERIIAGRPPERWHRIRQDSAKPKLDAQASWLDTIARRHSNLDRIAERVVLIHGRDRWERQAVKVGARKPATMLCVRNR